MRLICLLLLASTAHAETLRMKRFESMNLHLANQAGARHWTEDYTITLELVRGGKARVTSAGTRSDHDMTMMNGTAYNTDESATWTTTWHGAWTKKATSLFIALDLVKHDCKGEKNDNGTKSTQPCKTPSAKVQLACSTEEIAVEDRATNKSKKTAAWICSAAPGTELAESTGAWIFAKRGCVEVNGGRMTANTFARCRP